MGGLNRLHAVLLDSLVVLVAAGCATEPWGSEAPTPPAAHARAISDGVAKLAAVEAELTAAASNEPRRAGSRPDGSNYFTTLSGLARRGRDQAAQLSQETAERQGATRTAETTALLTKLDELAQGFAALDGACRQQKVQAVREARQAIATTMVALHSAVPPLTGG